MKKIALILVALVMLLMVAACEDDDAPSEQIKVGIVNLHPSESGYREANVQDMDRVFSVENGYDARKAYYNTLDEQLAAVRLFINDEVDYLLISAADADGWEDILTVANDAGIIVFLFDRMIDVSHWLYEAAVVSDMENQGVNAVDWLMTQNLPEYNFIHIQGQLGSAAQIGRTEPLEKAIAENANWNLVRQGTGGDTWNPEEARKIVEEAIAAGENFNIIYAENDGMAKGAMFALQDAGISHGVNGDVMIMGFDFNKFALRYVRDGAWNFDGQCSPFQADIIHEFIQRIESGENLNLSDKIVINDEIITDHNSITDAFIEQYGIGE